MVQTGPQGRRAAQSAVEGLQQALMPGPAARAPAAAREALTQVLARSEFHESWWDKEQRRFWEKMDRLARKLFQGIRWPELGGHWNTRVWGKVGLALLIIGGAAMLFLIIRLLTGRGPQPVSEEEFVPSARPKILLPCAAWLEEAERCRKSGDGRAGVRALHMAALMKLDEAGLVRYDHAYSDGRFVRLLQARGQAEAAGALRRLNQLFARIWYGHRPAGVQEYDEAAGLWREVEGRVSS